MAEFEVNPSEVLRETTLPCIIIGRIALRLTRASIRMVRVMISVLMARHTRAKELQQFCKKHGSNMGFLQVETESPEVLERFEARLREHEVEYSRLPDLQQGDGSTQYLYNLDNLQELEELIYQYEEEKLNKLDELKDEYADTTERYLAKKENLNAEMPAVTIITAEEYARTSIKDGLDTPEFSELEASADREMMQKQERTHLSGDDEVKDFFDAIRPDVLTEEKIPPVQTINGREAPSLLKRRRGR